MMSSQESSETTDRQETQASTPADADQLHTDATATATQDDDDILLLSPAMRDDSVPVGDDHASAAQHGGEPLAQPRHADHDGEILSVTDLRQIDLNKKAESTMSGPLPIPLNDETVSDTANSLSVLQKTLQDKYLREHEERKVAISHEGSLTVEDIVRQEVRVFLKKWLDAHLASIVQASVRKEVERLTQSGL